MNLSRELARTLLELAPDPTIVVDATGAVVFVNAQVERTFGYLPHEIIGQPVEMLLPQRFRSVHRTRRGEFAAQPKPRLMGEGSRLFGQHKSGREFPVEISLSPVQSDTGMLVVAAVRDATLRYDTERQLIEANRAKSRLLAAASHDLRQPVQTLGLLNQAATRHAGGNQALREILMHQRNALDTMAALLAAVLDVSKLDAGGVTPNIDDCAINDVFELLKSDFEPQAEAKGIVLVVEPTDESGRTDPEYLKRILGNLLSNAIRYTEVGRVSLSCRREGDELAITVRDTGIGIPAEELARIFEEFYQVDRGARRPEGLGLGLAIVRRFAALLNHRIHVESTIDEGTTFTVRLPRGERAVRASVPVAAPAREHEKGRILVVDDEVAVAHATGLLLELEGFEASIANDLDQALEQVARVRPDLIISDYHLRGALTGAQVVSAVRARLGAEIPAIFVTGDTGKLAAAETRLANSRLLSKPTRAEELLEEIRARLQARAATKDPVS